MEYIQQWTDFFWAFVSSSSAPKTGLALEIAGLVLLFIDLILSKALDKRADSLQWFLENLHGQYHDYIHRISAQFRELAGAMAKLMESELNGQLPPPLRDAMIKQFQAANQQLLSDDEQNELEAAQAAATADLITSFKRQKRLSALLRWIAFFGVGLVMVGAGLQLLNLFQQ